MSVCVFKIFKILKLFEEIYLTWDEWNIFGGQEKENRGYKIEKKDVQSDQTWRVSITPLTRFDDYHTFIKIV